MSEKKVLIVGIDGATFRIIRPLVEEGRIPNIAKMLDNGVHGVLQSTIPIVSAAAWTSLITGKKPGKHGIYDFQGKVPGSYKFELNTAKNRKAKPFWMNLSAQNKRVLVLGVTMTYPPDAVNGYMISGLGVPPDASMQSFVYPPNFATEIIDNLGQYRIVPEADLRRLSSSDVEKGKYLEGLLNQVEDRTKLFRYMWQKEAFDFSMILFLDIDGISHYLWKYMDKNHKQYQRSAYSDAIYKAYEKVDCAIGELLDTVGDDVDVILVSDHGFGPVNRVVFLNNWLESKEYLKYRNVRRVEAAFSKLVSLFKKRRRFVRKRKVEWEKTKAYFNGTVGNIFINRKGREPEGIVDSTEYEGLCSEIKRELLNLKDPDSGENVVEGVYTKEALFNAGNIVTAPDLVVVFREGYDVVGEQIGLHGIRDTGKVIVNSNNWSGSHEPDGVFIAYGKSFRKGYEIQDANIIDVAPTLLYQLGVPIPESMDGKLMKGIFNDKFLQSNPILYTKDDEPMPEMKGYQEGDSDKVLDQLRNLGYID